VSEQHGAVRFAEVPDHAAASADVASALALLTGKLRAQGHPWALRVRLGPADLPIKLVRVIVPGCELYGHGITNMGPRLRRHLESSR
jgi:hypothetical protein